MKTHTYFPLVILCVLVIAFGCKPKVQVPYSPVPVAVQSDSVFIKTWLYAHVVEKDIPPKAHRSELNTIYTSKITKVIQFN